MKYLIVCEKSATGWGACALALRQNADQGKELIREAVEFHWEGVRARGDPIPAPSAMTGYITIDDGLAGCGKR